MAAARVEKARTAGACSYSPQRLNEAEVALAEAREALSDKDSYRKAIRAAARASAQADEARAEALAEKAKASRAAERCLQECRALLEEASYLGARKVHGEKLESLAARIDPLQRLLEEGEPSDARVGAEELKADLLSFVHEIKKQGGSNTEKE
jgi:hypothetical protein